jgi:hypothetical protein
MTPDIYIRDIDFQQSVENHTLSQLTKKSQLRDGGLTNVSTSKVIVGSIHDVAEGRWSRCIDNESGAAGQERAGQKQSSLDSSL